MRLYSTLERGPVELPGPPGPVRIYVCGPTVYARAHVGNARPFVVAMWLRSWLRARGYEVVLVHNITDINDKIYAAAREQGVSSDELARRATDWYLEDTGAFGLGMPDHLPKATETVPQIVAAIDELVSSGHAYAVEGDVYFRVASDPDYGRLSGQRPEQVQDEEPSPLKEDARDFALWKASKPGEDTAWDSSWGRGRPGWHIECSVMAEELLGPVFEIHGGGLDLVFPHHENELAQSHALGHDFARIWMHNGMLRFVGEKMSKSVGNVMTIREALDEWGPETLLLFFLTGHWRSPIDFSIETMLQARAQVDAFRELFRMRIDRATQEFPANWDGVEAARQFEAALDNDFNTPDALAILHAARAAWDRDFVLERLHIFGLGSLAEEEEAPAELHVLARRRLEARQRKDYVEADRLRSEIEGDGWDVRDVPEEPGYQLVRR